MRRYTLDGKESMPNLFVPEDKNAVAHGDQTLDVLAGGQGFRVEGLGFLQNEHSNDVESPPSPPFRIEGFGFRVPPERALERR